MSEFICLLGVDGVGKTLHARQLKEALSQNGVRTKYVWLRFVHITTLFLLGYCRVAGLTIYEDISGISVGKHCFYKSKLVAYIYPRLLYIDLLPAYLLKIVIPRLMGQTIICDRFVFDTIIDLMIDLNNDHFHETSIGRKYLHLVPEDAKLILLDLDLELIHKRRPELAVDALLARRQGLYRKLAQTYGIPIIDNAQSVSSVQKDILRALGDLND
jgi:thymidylate kinase